jgi:hypothetical protein
MDNHENPQATMNLLRSKIMRLSIVLVLSLMVGGVTPFAHAKPGVVEVSHT